MESKFWNLGDFQTERNWQKEIQWFRWSAWQILCYLKVVPEYGSLYKNYGHINIACFSDINRAGSKKDKKLNSRYCVSVDGNLISWKSKKQNVVSHSSVESKYRGMTQSMCELIWITSCWVEIWNHHTDKILVW